MKSQMVWVLLVSFLLMCAMLGCGEKPQPVVEAPVDGPTGSVVEEPELVTERSSELASEPSDATRQHESRSKIVKSKIGQGPSVAETDGREGSATIEENSPMLQGAFLISDVATASGEDDLSRRVTDVTITVRRLEQTPRVDGYALFYAINVARDMDDVVKFCMGPKQYNVELFGGRPISDGFSGLDALQEFSEIASVTSLSDLGAKNCLHSVRIRSPIDHVAESTRPQPSFQGWLGLAQDVPEKIVWKVSDAMLWSKVFVSMKVQLRCDGEWLAASNVFETQVTRALD